MPYESHRELATPDDDAIIWRYMSFVKLMDLLERRVLWFARVDTLEDPLEGTHTDAEIEYFQSQPEPSAHPMLRNFAQQYIEGSQMVRETVFVNCWRVANAESMAMWDIYGKGTGVVAIKSTIRRLKTVLKPFSRSVFIGKVQYVDWSRIAWNLNTIAMAMRKDQSYVHEQEVRAVIWGLATKDGEQPIVPYSITEDGTMRFAGPAGIEVPCNLEELVTEIVIGPREQEMFQKLLGPILRRYDMNIRVIVSDRLKSRLSLG